MRLVSLGRVVGVYGVRGWIRVHSYTRPAENLLQYRRWRLQCDTPYEAQVLEARTQGSGLVASITGADGVAISDRDLAARLLGADIQVDRAEMPEPPEGSYYWADLIGLAVYAESGQMLGTVAEMMDNGAQDVLIVDDHGTRRLIPFVRGPIVKAVDLAAGTISVDWQPDW